MASSAIVLTGVVAFRQITALQDNGRLLARLDHSATHDALTELPNRALFGRRLQKALASPGDRTVSVALIDLDDFKIVNDTLGHETGDVLLVAAARRLATCLRDQDTVARLGGDEFVVILDGIDRAGADAAAERIMAALARPVVAGGHELRIRASIGIADGRSGDEASQLLRHADIRTARSTSSSWTVPSPRSTRPPSPRSPPPRSTWREPSGCTSSPKASRPHDRPRPRTE
jgi:diguanylate cyclase (GGDEF)-like protein